MLHVVRVAPSGSVSYANRYVRTARYAQETRAGWPLLGVLWLA